jgi:hypothetical protein
MAYSAAKSLIVGHCEVLVPSGAYGFDRGLLLRARDRRLRAVDDDTDAPASAVVLRLRVRSQAGASQSKYAYEHPNHESMASSAAVVGWASSSPSFGGYPVSGFRSPMIAASRVGKCLCR